MQRFGETHTKAIYSLYALFKKAIRIVNNAGYLEHTNPLFLKSHAMKFMDLINYKTALIMFRARNNTLPGNLQKLFCDRDGRCGLRGELDFRTQYARLTLKRMCISVRGVKLWNGLP